MPSANDLDAVTVDAFGTLVELVDPRDRLAAALAAAGVRREDHEIADAFAVEVAHYVPRSHQGRDETSLRELRQDCTRVFLDAVGAELDPETFAPAFVGALEFELVPGVRTALGALRAGGLSLACVANWDISAGEQLERLDVRSLFATVVTSAEAGVAKPDPGIFSLALRRLGVAPSRALHIGDGPADKGGAHAAGLAFEPVPLATLPARLGLASPP